MMKGEVIMAGLNDTMFTANQLSKLQSLAEELRVIPTNISRDMETYNYCISETNMATWINGTAAGESVATRIRKAISTCEEINSIINKTISTIETAVAEAKVNNSKTIGQ